MPWILLFAALWSVIGWLARGNPQSVGSLVGAGVGATVALSIFLAGRAQGRRQTTLDLFKEYYSADFAMQRRAAEQFMDGHRAVDWSRNDPYVIGRDDDDLAGYGAVLRFWQRVATLYDEGEINRGLAQRLLSRELGYWDVKIIQPMRGRKGMYVRDMIADLVRRFSIGERPKALASGAASARRLHPQEHDHPTGDDADAPTDGQAKVPVDR